MNGNDFFKPLYKAHRRIGFEDLIDVFDPHCAENRIDVTGYLMEKETDNRWICKSLPGLEIIINSLSLPQQAQLIKESLADHLESPEHLSNLDAHYSLNRPLRLFQTKEAKADELSPGSATLVRDKLRWVTLGGQYNWTTKKYPSYEPGTPGCPYFPNSLTKDICSKFEVVPEAAIINYYSEGNILSPHQDITELTDNNLVSISLGCSCIFYISNERFSSKPLSIVLRSGDIIVMGGKSRFAFHGVGRIFAASTPKALCNNTEFTDDNFESWMLNHRININVRQMK